MTYDSTLGDHFEDDEDTLDDEDTTTDKVTLTIPKPRVPKFVKGTAHCVGSKTAKVAKDLHIQAAGLIETHEVKAQTRRRNGRIHIKRLERERQLAEQMAEAMGDEES